MHKQFGLLVNVRRLKLTGPLHKQTGSLYLKFDGKKILKVPDDNLDARATGPSIVSYASSQGGCGFDLTIVEGVTKVAVELYSHSQLMLEDRVLCMNYLNVHKLKGTVKTELQLYSENEHKHIASVYLELERRAEQSIGPSKFLEEVSKRVATQGLLRLEPEEQKSAINAKMPELKKAEWKDYVGLRDNFELMKMTDLI